MLEATEERDDSTDEVTLAAEDPTEEEDALDVTATPVAEDEAEEVAVEAIVDVQDTACESRRQYLLEF